MVVMLVAAAFLWLLHEHEPIIPYLDVTILVIGIFLVCGRIGCLMVGCCHGKPHRWGVLLLPRAR
jgi:prolipoprotein diacylglyceryltransferase